MNRELLEKPFPQSDIKRRKGRGGDMWDYIPAPLVIKRLNEAFEGSWTFEVKEHLEIGDEMVVLARLTAGGVSKEQFGSKEIERYSKGPRQDLVISYGDTLKAAASDALKKCSAQFGVALDLYMDEEQTSKRPSDGKAKNSQKPPKPEKKTMGDLKNDIRNAETTVLEADSTFIIADFRDQHFGSGSLPNDRTKLDEYLEKLRKRYTAASKEAD